MGQSGAGSVIAIYGEDVNLGSKGAANAKRLVTPNINRLTLYRRKLAYSFLSFLQAAEPLEQSPFGRAPTGHNVIAQGNALGLAYIKLVSPERAKYPPSH